MFVLTTIITRQPPSQSLSGHLCFAGINSELPALLAQGGFNNVRLSRSTVCIQLCSLICFLLVVRRYKTLWV